MLVSNTENFLAKYHLKEATKKNTDSASNNSHQAQKMDMVRAWA